MRKRKHTKVWYLIHNLALNIMASKAASTATYFSQFSVTLWFLVHQSFDHVVFNADLCFTGNRLGKRITVGFPWLLWFMGSCISRILDDGKESRAYGETIYVQNCYLIVERSFEFINSLWFRWTSKRINSVFENSLFYLVITLI